MNSKKEIYENAPLAPLWRLQSKTKRFYTPIPIAVKAYRDEDFFFAENENLAVCGTGDTPQDALQDLELHITHFFEYYKNLDKGGSRLAPPPGQPLHSHGNYCG